MSEMWSNFKQMLGGPAESAAAPVQAAAPAVATSSGSTSMLGTAREKRGHLVTGARRLKKSRKSKKKTRRTRRNRR
jgi:hypothetical protein